MKSLLFLLLVVLLIPFKSSAQAALPDTLRYQEVVPVPGVSADELYGRVREWVALTFEDVHQVLQLEDAQRHVVIGSGYSRVHTRRPNGKPGASDKLWLRFRVETRAGRYRVEISNLGAVHDFSTSDHPAYVLHDLNRWIQAAQATQAESQRHEALSQGFPAISTYLTTEQVGLLKAGLDESMQRLLQSLRKTVTAPPIAW